MLLQRNIGRLTKDGQKQSKKKHPADCVCAKLHLHANGCTRFPDQCVPVRVCPPCDVCVGSPLTRSSAGLLCPVGGISPRAGLIGVTRAALKSHQCLEMLSKTGKLLLGNFRQLPDSVCPCLLHCLSQYPSLLKSLITPQFPSALFLSRSLSVGFKH